ncbi:hypothetical protein CROQUDRAFT_437460 [Cronartium quercuum f. sp. fusiforme G11]|uniref:Uncharacterized protein n=1 Tax=Cronartium quercuum f. sp. fusiforme G11 TaxID=708437 RepID=A0A9P6N5H4_9BASI|nr:hypothetical protein CROQUDRAFT_437460 [Cronartium quercuum f. sp. fusiforme G11]
MPIPGQTLLLSSNMSLNWLDKLYWKFPMQLLSLSSNLHYILSLGQQVWIGPWVRELLTQYQPYCIRCDLLFLLKYKYHFYFYFLVFFPGTLSCLYVLSYKTLFHCICFIQALFIQISFI